MDVHERQAKVAEMRERLATIDPVTRMVNLIVGVRWIKRRPLAPDISLPFVAYRIMFGERCLGVVRRRSTARGGGRWYASDAIYPSLRAAERALVEANIGDILKALAPTSGQEDRP
jgi:hypothetical protein